VLTTKVGPASYCSDDILLLVVVAVVEKVDNMLQADFSVQSKWHYPYTVRKCHNIVYYCSNIYLIYLLINVTNCNSNSICEHEFDSY